MNIEHEFFMHLIDSSNLINIAFGCRIGFSHDALQALRNEPKILCIDRPMGNMNHFVFEIVSIALQQ